MRALTPDQERAADRRRGSLLLSAGAGSGKTSVLVERFVRAVHEDGVAPGRILAITFTDRAAAELRDRVRERLRGLGDRELARDSERAPIGTVHAFCARILRAHAVAIGVDPGFEVLDEGLAADLRERAFATALRGLLDSGGGPAVDLVAAYGADRVQGAILAAYDALRTRGEREPRLPAPPADADLAAAGRRLVRAVALAREEIREAVGGGVLAASAERALEALDCAAAVADAAGGHPPPGPGAFAALTLPGAGGAVAGGACGGYREALDAYAQVCADRHAVAALRLLDELLERFDRAYATAKHERGALDFDDLEIEASRLLEGDEALRRSWAARFELVMIDEFQDTNPRQMRILRALERDNLFTVGDEFQSIYGFRHADVGLFRERRAALAARGSTLELADNFRGRPELLAAVNAVFVPAFGPDFTPLAAGREALASAGEPLVELLVTDQRGWEDPLVDPSPGLPQAARWRQAEARLLAQRIGELLDEGVAAPGEVAVLLRATGDVPVFARALEDTGIATLIADGGGYWSGPEVLDLLAYLRTLANPLDDVALYGALASPLVGASSDALALLARARGSGRPWPALMRLFGGPTPAGEELEALRTSFSEADVAALTAFLALVRRERRLVARRGVDTLLRRVVRETGYDAHLLGLPFPERRRANVDKLLRLARRHEHGEGGGLRGFLDHAERRRAGAAREPDAPVADADSDAVRVMTIHAAKGLEFDVVAVADLGRQGRGDPPDLLLDGERIGLRLATLDGSAPVATLAFAALRDERLAAEAEEERRILYVAMTRARERLLLSGAVNPERWPAPRPTAPALGWLGPALAEDLPARLSSEQPVIDLHPPGAPGVTVRCRLNAPATVGAVLRARTPRLQEARAPGDGTPPARPPELARLEAGAPVPAPRAGSGALSYTALAEYERCGYRYYLERVLGLPPDDRLPAGVRPSARSGALPGRVRGSLVHRLLETFDFRRPAGPGAERVAALAAELGAAPAPDELAEIARLVAAVADTELGARLASAPRVRREHPFGFSLGDDLPLVSGVVDLIAHEMGGGCLIVDYKSDRVGGDDLGPLTERDYGVQRRVYGLAALRGGALTVDVVHWYLQRPTEPVTVRYTAADDARLTAELRERAGAVVAGHYPVSSRPHRELCLACPGRRALCSHPPSATLGPAPDAAPVVQRDDDPIVARSGAEASGSGGASVGRERA